MHDERRSFEKRGKRSLPIRLMVIVGALVLGFFAWRVQLLYGGDAGEAGTVIYGMLLFLGGIVILAFVVVLLAKLARGFFGRDARSPLEPPDKP